MAVIQVKRGDIHYENLDPVVGKRNWQNPTCSCDSKQHRQYIFTNDNCGSHHGY